MGECAGKESSKKRRAEDDAGRHLTYYARLANALEDPAQGASCQQNGSDGEYELFRVHVPKAWLTFFIKFFWHLDLDLEGAPLFRVLCEREGACPPSQNL